MSRAGGIFEKKELFEYHRKLLFEDFDGHHLRDAGDRTPVRHAVDLSAAAVSATGEIIHHVAFAGFRVEAADTHVAACPSRRGKKPIRNCRDKGVKDRLGYSLAYFRRTTRNRTWIFGIQERSVGLPDPERLENSGVHRNVRKYVLHRQIDRRAGRG